MIGYVTLGVSDMGRAKQFYTDLLADLGAKVLMDMDRIAFIGKSMGAPMLAVCTPFNGEPNHPGNGNMVAIPAGSKEAVDKLYHKAIELGGDKVKLRAFSMSAPPTLAPACGGGIVADVNPALIALLTLCLCLPAFAQKSLSPAQAKLATAAHQILVTHCGKCQGK